uniref:NADH dehydrogenase subunit 5 n=1 Tax=Laemobothrion tinnunculi TaxID=1941263 RepID=UPI0021D529E7|nr:NADH dehydrogenase subunit 5 [Laemobothrion tinnunculi]UXC94701.1 NADH dehydrogenase subunit 5 [Laemobothrion tinnunculi]UXC94714.1 NADH dehydrogenase subunit 5 [Laemobothrion tinnunculi]
MTMYFLNMDCSIEYELMENFCYMFHFDLMTNLYVMTVMLISSAIFMYSKEYIMKEEKINTWFYPCLSFFVLSMLILIMSSSLVTSLIGWEGLGITSIILILHYFSKKAMESAFYTYFITRLGDSFFLIASAYWLCSTLNVEFINLSSAPKLVIFFLIALMTKSAMLPFSEWLPKAMMAPTPISSLVHSSTLITAGILLMMRYNSMISSLTNTKWFLIIAVTTLFVSSVSAFMATDLKKIIAMSTLSQMMMIIITVLAGNSKLAFIHLTMHAFTKAMLFMIIGSILHYSQSEQDTRKIFINMKTYPLLSIMLNSAIMSLCGMFFFSGFYSKDMIMEMFMYKKTIFFMFILINTSVCLTTIYSFRILNLINLIPNNTWTMKSTNMKMLQTIMIMLFYTTIFGTFFIWILPLIPFNLMTKSDKIFLQIIILSGMFTGWYWFYKIYFFFSSSWYIMFIGKMASETLKILTTLTQVISSMLQFYNSMMWSILKKWATLSHQNILFNSKNTLKTLMLISMIFLLMILS